MADTPKVRFKGFTGAWEQRKLGEIILDYTEKNPDGEDLPVLTSSRQGIQKQEDHFGSEQKHDTTDYNVIPKGYCTYRNRSDDKTFTFNVNDCVQRGIVSKFYPVFSIENGDAKFITEYLNTNAEIRNKLAVLAVGTSQVVLSLKNLKTLDILVPSKGEQDKVGQVIISLDHLITLHQRKCDETKELKKYMLQKMFPKDGEKIPEIRFKGFTEDWEQRKLGDVFAERIERANGDEELLSVTIGNGVIRQADSDKRNTASEDRSNYKVVRKGDVPYNSMRMWQGAVGNSEYDGIVSPAYTVLVPMAAANGKFFMELFKKESTLKIFQRWSQGLTSDTWNLKYPVLSTIELYMPSLEEQTKIANYFLGFDHLITLHQRKCDQLKEVKKFMLQNMFPQKG
ncbi:MAG: restriction endonuclease subunit S [Lachnospiraceae bacterium]|nr:restriction endonuclease subunit S [Lachnospiraceae bacterium]